MKYLGVFKNTLNRYHKREKPFKAQIRIDGKTVDLGEYDTEREAAMAYDKKAITLGRETNFLKKKK